MKKIVKTTNARVRYLGLALLTAAILLTVSSGLAGCAPAEELPVMPIDCVAALADRGEDTLPGDVLQYRHEEFDSEGYTLYQFKLGDSRFSLWAGYRDSTDEIEYLCLVHNTSQNKLYLFHRLNEELPDGSLKFGENATSYDVNNFIATQTAE